MWPIGRSSNYGAEGVRAHTDHGDDTTRAVLDWSRGHGVDAVLLTAATAVFRSHQASGRYPP